MASLKAPPGAATAFPDRREQLALQASLLDGEKALEAWRRLGALQDGPPSGIWWIAPLLMANIARLAPQDSWVTANPKFLTLSGLQARATARNAALAIDALGAASIRTMALKGLALGATVYPAAGLRSVSDIDLLVPLDRAFDAFEALVAAGYRTRPDYPQSLAELRGNHAHVFHSPRRREDVIDLHWHLLASARGDRDDDPFWEAAREISIEGRATYVLCDEDQLLHALVHGVRWTRMPHVRWVADAAMILRGAKDFRIDRFLAMTERFDAVTPVQEGLRFLRDVIGEGDALLDAALGLKPSRFSKKAFKARATAYETRSLGDRVALRIEDALWRRRARAKTRKE